MGTEPAEKIRFSTPPICTVLGREARPLAWHGITLALPTISPFSGYRDYRWRGFSFRHPPALLLAMICFNMALSAGALTFSPRRMATVRAVLLS